MSVTRAVRKFILSNYLFTDDETALDDEQSLVTSGIIDSTGAVELIMHLEHEFGIKVAEEEMVPDHLDSVSKIAAFVNSKRA